MVLGKANQNIQNYCPNYEVHGDGWLVKKKTPDVLLFQEGVLLIDT